MLKRIWNSVIPVRMHQPQGEGDSGSEGARRKKDLDPSDPQREGSRAQEEEEIFPAYDDDAEHPMRPVQPFIGSHDDLIDEPRQTMRIEVPTRTILKIIGTLIAIWLILQVLSIFLLLVLATFICLALLPPVRRLERQGIPRVAAAASIYLMFALILVGFVALILPPLIDQIESVIENAPEYAESFDAVLEDYPTVSEQIDNFAGTSGEAEQSGADEVEEEEKEGPRTQSRTTSRSEEVVAAAVDAETVTVGAGRVVGILTGLVGGVANAFFVVVLAFYLLIEGDRTWRYVARYMTPRLRYRFHRLGPELTNVVSGYVIGQSIISGIFGVFSYIVLTVLGVPQPLLLALIGAVSVAIPIVGVPISTIIMMALALTVSWQTAAIVLAVNIVYQQIENYVLLPRVYGNTLQVSALSILVGVLVGGQLLGVLGIILSLPVTASIPVIERVWREVTPNEVEQMEREMAADESSPSERAATSGD
ncbi:MAG: AI-2E family transporter [Thermomicrobiales bacterium]|jgi:predicted PurR-regulated permease PerM